MRNQLPRASRATRIKRLRPQIYFAFITLLGVKRAEVHRILGQRNLRSIQLFGEQLQILEGKASLGSDLVFGFQPNYKPPRGRLNQNMAA